MKILLAAGLFALIWFSLTYRMFRAIFTRAKNIPGLLEMGEGSHSWINKYRGEIEDGIDWYKSTPRVLWETTSHDKLTLRGYFYPRENARGAVLLFHGYMSSCERDFCASAKWYYENGFSVLSVFQRAHSESEGKYITLGAKERKDVHAWVKEAACRLGIDTPMILSGVSMGATSVLCASEQGFGENVRALIADCGFESPKRTLEEQAARRNMKNSKLLLIMANLLAKTAAGCSLDECSTVRAMEKNTMPVFFLHGTDDVVVPHQNSVDAANACKAPHVLRLVEGSQHTNAFLVGGEELHAEMLEFIEKYI